MDARSLGEQVRRCRLLDDLTQEEVARRVNVSVLTLSNLEHGRGASVGTLVKVLVAMDRADWQDLLEPAPEISPMAVMRAELRGFGEPQRASRRSKRRTRRPDTPAARRKVMRRATW